MKIRFIGALGSVTGSCTLLNHRNRYYLVDCGMHQGCESAVAQNRSPFSFKPSTVSAVFLTHAHMDHCGLLPRLVKEGFKGKVYCTRATADLTALALKDAAAFAGDLYSDADVDGIQFQCVDDDDSFQYGEFHYLDVDLTYSFIRTSHVLGSVAVEFQFAKRVSKGVQQRRTIVFSGDVGNNTDGNPYQPLLKPCQHPSSHAEYIVFESTYGNRVRAPQFMDYNQRLQAVEQTLLHASTLGPQPVVIIPCFALQRAQEMLCDLHYLIEHHLTREQITRFSGGQRIHILLDSALAMKYGAVYARELTRKRRNGTSYYQLGKQFTGRYTAVGEDPELVIKHLLVLDSSPRHFKHFSLHSSPASLNGHTGMRIIIAGSGMCNGGRVVQHLKAHLPHHTTMVVLTGYQARGTPGSELMKRVDNLSGLIAGDVLGMDGADIMATVVNLSAYYSGHADQEGLLNFLFAKKPGYVFNPMKKVFLIHGEEGARRALQDAIMNRSHGCNGDQRLVEAVACPDATQCWYDLDDNCWVDEYHSAIDDPVIAATNLTRRIRLLKALLQQLNPTTSALGSV